jgi:hypothetical protein
MYRWKRWILSALDNLFFISWFQCDSFLTNRLCIWNRSRDFPITLYIASVLSSEGSDPPGSSATESVIKYGTKETRPEHRHFHSRRQSAS